MDPTLAATELIVGAVDSGAVAVAVRVCGALAWLPTLSRSAEPPEAVNVTVTKEPSGAGTMIEMLAIATPLSAAAVQNGTLSPIGVAGNPFTETCQSVEVHGAIRQTALLNCADAMLPLTLSPVNTGLPVGGIGISHTIVTAPLKPYVTRVVPAVAVVLHGTPFNESSDVMPAPALPAGPVAPVARLRQVAPVAPVAPRLGRRTDTAGRPLGPRPRLVVALRCLRSPWGRGTGLIPVDRRLVFCALLASGNESQLPALVLVAPIDPSVRAGDADDSESGRRTSQQKGDDDRPDDTCARSKVPHFTSSSSSSQIYLERS